MGMSADRRNLELPRVVDELLDQERSRGTTITKTLCAALHWYFNRLVAAQRELARIEAAEWAETGEVPESDIADEMEAALRAARGRAKRPPGRRSSGA